MILIIVLLLLFPSLYYLLVRYSLVCRNSIICQNFILYELTPSVLFIPLFISASLLFVIFFSEKVFKIFKKFIIFAVPLMLLLIIITKSDPLSCGMFLCVNRTFVVFLSGGLYLFISIVITFISAIYFKTKDKKQNYVI